MNKELCRIAHRRLAEFQRTTPGLPGGTTGVVMAIHSFGEYLDSQPPAGAIFSWARGAPGTPEKRRFPPQTPISKHPGMEVPASSFKLRANAPEG